jgi:hypothetical protein
MKLRHHVQAGVKVYFLNMVLVLTLKSEVIVFCLFQLSDITHAYSYSYH